MKEKIKNYLKHDPLIIVELLLCIAVPIATAVLLGTSRTQTPNYLPLLLVALFMAFVYGLIKVLFRLKKRNTLPDEAGEAGETVARKPKSLKYRIFVLITAVIMPVAGLLLNNEFGGIGTGGGIFGDFSNIWFYIIAVANGLLMLINVKESLPSLLLFYLKVVGFTFISYFMLVFIPIMPLGIVGLVFYGLGIFAFVPMTVFITEVVEIFRDVEVLKARYKGGVIAALFLGMVTIPAVLMVNFSIDKINFGHAMAYLTADVPLSEAAKMPRVNTNRLEATLRHNANALNNRTDRWSILDNGGSTPVITRAYRALVLDGGILPLDVTQRLYRVFLATDDEQPIRENAGWQHNVNIVAVDTSTVYDENIGVYQTWVDLELRNEGDSFLAEYRTQFVLPDGCFIKDYYLDVGEEKKPGILADKRAALITYNNILRTPRDPGIIYYSSDTAVELRVYPFGRDEVRRTGFLVWHSQDELLWLDGEAIALTAGEALAEPLDLPGISFVPAAHKENLPPMARTPRFFFIIDASAGSLYHENVRKMQDYVQLHGITEMEVYAVSYRVEAVDWRGTTQVRREGGFNLPLAMEMIFRAYEHDDSYFPVIVAVSDHIAKAPDFQKSSLAKRFPESPYYYNLGWDLTLTPYAFADGKWQESVATATPIIANALDYQGFAVAADGRSEVILGGAGSADAMGSNTYTTNAYHNAFILYGRTVDANDFDVQAGLVRDSFRQRLLTHYTAFTVLETREQEESLLELQAKLLSADGMNAPAVMMSEPGWLLYATLGLGLVILAWGRRRRRLGG